MAKLSYRFATLSSLLLIATSLSPARAADPADLIARGAVGLELVDRLLLPPVENGVFLARDAAAAGPGVAPRYAEPLKVDVTPQSHGSWETLDDGTLLWRLRVVSPGALSINLGFTRFRMPEGGRLLLYTPDQKQVVRPFTARDNKPHGQLWTPILRGDEVVIEVQMNAHLPELRLTHVLHGYAPFGRLPGWRKSGACNVDVVCPEGDAWRDQIRSVAVIGTGGGAFCTGFLVNNTAQDLTPYFQTAMHCGIDAATAPSLVVYWNFENSVCRAPGSSDSGAPGDGTLTDFQTGSTLRAAHTLSDVTLVELDSLPDPAWNVFWAGWDATPADFSGAVALHHPSADEKRISFENDPTTTTAYGGSSSPGDGTHVRVADWDLGTTEPGSSGSPLFNPAGRVIGQLHGGLAACGNDDADWYGRVSVSWQGGGTAATRLVDWLDPTGSGVLTLDGRDAAPSFNVLPSPASLDVCAGEDAVYTVDVTQILGFSDPVTLSVSGEPGTAEWSVNPVTPPGQSTLTLGTLGSDGFYPLTVTGTSGALSRPAGAALDVFATLPGLAGPTAPADGAVDQPLDVTLQWSAEANAHVYDVEIATDAAFTTTVDSTTGIEGTQHTSDLPEGSSTYYWRVRGRNGCGPGPWSATRSFVTEALPGDCLADHLEMEVWAEDFESGAPGWTTGGNGSTWALTGGNVHRGTAAYHAAGVSQVSDQYLETPAVSLPAVAASLTLQFWNHQAIEDSASGCFDGAVLEISTDGVSWTRIETELLTDPYDGPVSTTFDSPIGGENAWCGDPQNWLRSIVDVSAWAGQEVVFRFRLATDRSISRDGWTIDDVRVRGCADAEIFADGFESGDVSRWSSAPGTPL